MLGHTPAEYIARVIDDRIDRRQAISHATRRTRKIYHKRRSSDAGNAARQRSPRKCLQGKDTNAFCDSRGITLDYSARCFWRDIARRKSGATRSQDEIRVACVAPRSEPRDDRDSVVGYYVVTSDRVSALRAPLSDDTTRHVGTIARSDGIGDSKNRNAHGRLEVRAALIKRHLRHSRRDSSSPNLDFELASFGG